MKQKTILFLLVIVCGVIVILNEIILNETPECFPKADEIGQLLSYFSMAYISSYLFYRVVNVNKEKRDKKALSNHLYKLTGELISKARTSYSNILEASRVNQEEYDVLTITREQFTEICKAANPNDIPANRMIGNSPFNASPATYARFIHDRAYLNVRYLIDRIFVYMPFLQSEHVRLLNEIEKSTFFITAQTLSYPRVNNTFEVYADNIFDYLALIRNLEEYMEQEIKPYTVFDK